MGTEVSTRKVAELRQDTASAAEIIVTDLDQTLVKTDLTIESILKFVSRNPINIFVLIGWMIKGRSVMKAKLAEVAMPNIDMVPLNQEVVDYLQTKKASGATLVLASASNLSVVEKVAQRLGIFDHVFGSQPGNNLKGSDKADALIERFGEGAFVYLGDSPADLSIWKSAQRAVTVGAGKALRRKAEHAAQECEHIQLESRTAKTWWRGVTKQLRPHQWSKNVLIFVPAFAAQEFAITTLIACVLALISFSLTASSVYVINDLLDLEADRAHPRKRLRPFASGALPIKDGFVLAPMLLGAALLIGSLFLPFIFVATLAGYFVLTLSYSLILKQKIMVDVFVLAALYTIRIVAGGTATEIPMSPWLLGFSLFFFLALALIKRIAELVDIIQNDRGRASKRDYTEIDLGTIQSLAAAAGYAAIVVLTFYFTSPEATSLYGSPELLWGVSPLLLFWISRMLALASRGHMDDDPIVFSAKDRTSLAVGFLVFCIALAAAMA